MTSNAAAAAKSSNEVVMKQYTPSNLWAGPTTVSLAELTAPVVKLSWLYFTWPKLLGLSCVSRASTVKS